MTNCSSATRSAPEVGTAQIIIPPGERLGDNVIEVEGCRRPMATGC
jgi:hypothetical protein